jgi:hypothetical protein
MAGEGDELLVHDCDLEATRFGKACAEIERRSRTYSAVTTDPFVAPLGTN